MIVVDTSVWIDFFRGAETAYTRGLRHLIETDEAVTLTDLILTEILQGLSTEAEAARVDDALAAFDVLLLEPLGDHRWAASTYRECRRRGITVRSTVDVLIAAVCVREGAALLAVDRDFERLAPIAGLELVPVA